MSEALTTEASEEEEDVSVLYDVENVMGYIIDSISDEGSLVYAHYTQDTEDEDVTCLDCHDLDILRELYLLCDEDENEDYEDDMSSASTTAVCLACHGSYEELAALGAELVDEDGNIVNPHDTHRGEVDCCKCHLVHDTEVTMVEKAYTYCYSCHHYGSFDPSSCYSSICHEEGYFD
jgi:hypothetical protein